MTGMLRSGLMFALGLFILLAAWWPDMESLAYLAWNVEIYTHSWMVPLISLWLISRRSDALKVMVPAPSVWGLLILSAAATLWLGGMLIDAQLPRHVALVLALQGLVLGAFGWQLYRHILFPMLFLFLAVPFGDSLVAPLQTMTAQLVIRMLTVLGVPVSVDGVLITLSSGTYEVAQACAGVKFLFTSVVMSVLMAHLAFESWRRRALMLGAGLTVPILANALRVLGILLIAEATDQSFAKGVDHVVYGWVFLSAVLLVLISIAYKFADRQLDEAAAPVLAAPRVHRFATPLMAAALVLPLLVRQILPPVDPAHTCPLPPVTAPDCADCDFRALDSKYVHFWPEFVGADQEVKALYRNAGTRLQLYMALYSPERPGHQLTNAQNRVAGEGWLRLPGVGRGAFEIGDYSWQESVQWQRDARRLVWTLYLVDGHAVTPGRSGKLRAGLSRLDHGFNRAGVLILSTDIIDGIEAAQAELATFLSTFPPDTFLWTQILKPDGDSVCAASAG